jgi:hypothetical protein
MYKFFVTIDAKGIKTVVIEHKSDLLPIFVD